MSKTLGRPLFRNNAPRATAHGTGITAYFMNDRPGYAEGDEVDYQKLMQDYLTRPAAQMPEAPASDFETLYKKYSDVVGKSLGPERSYDELLKERMRILGPTTDAESARNYALMQLGSRIAGTSGGLSRGLAAGMPEYASVMSKAEADRRAAERAVAANAFEAYDKERGLRRSAESEAAKYAFTESSAAEKAAYNAAVERANKAEERKFEALKEGAKFQAERKDKYGALGTETFAIPDPDSVRGFKIVGARRTPQGLVQVGNGEPVPENAIPASESLIADIYKQGQPKEATNISIQNPDGTFGKPQAAIQKGGKFYDVVTDTVIDRPFRLADKTGGIGSGTSASYVIHDENSPFGVKEVIGFTDPTNGQNYYMHNGVRFEFDSAKGIRASLSDVLKSETKDGETTTTPTYGPYAGKPFTVSSEIGGLKIEPPIPSQDPSLKSTAPKQEGSDKVTMGQITTTGPDRYFVKEISRSAIPWSQSSAQDKQDSRNRVQNAENILRTAEDSMQAMKDALGPANYIKGLASNWLDPIAPEALKPYVNFLKTEAGKQQLLMLKKQVELAETLNPRFPQGELKTINELTESPEKFFSTPEQGIAKFSELVRKARNAIEWETAYRDNRKPLYITRIPTGTENDPFSYDKMPFLFELKQNGVNINRLFFIDRDNTKKQVGSVIK
jgi:hypothetical protein